jgi:hypothetical protein
VDYFAFLLQWFNWPYLAAFVIGIASIVIPASVRPLGLAMAGWFGVGRVRGHVIARVFGFALGIIGLTVNGGLHDYWPEAQERGFLPGLVVSILLATLITRRIGRAFERHFPEIRAVGWGSPDLSGQEGRVVSRVVSPEYRAGRAQVMGENETLHMVLCKTKEGEIPYGAAVVLGEYDAGDGRYFVLEVGVAEETIASEGTTASEPEHE